MKSSEQTWLKLMLTTAVKVQMNKTEYLRLHFSLTSKAKLFRRDLEDGCEPVYGPHRGRVQVRQKQAMTGHGS